ncbi:hypothetical protein [Candidatus Uabimicrobium sp. HlEnr_7]|uniref:hypothetical protein n=1 Tax=Candidatus Uabimicrobium helgolandensis TaxID=3095367 RepID=UPI00355625B8
MTKTITRIVTVLMIVFTIVAVVATGLLYVSWSSSLATSSGYCKIVSLCKAYSLYHVDFGENNFPPFEKLFELEMLEKKECWCHERIPPYTYHYNIYGQEIKRERDFNNFPTQVDYCYLYDKSIPKTFDAIIAYCPQHTDQGNVPVVHRDLSVSTMRWSKFQKIYEQQVHFLKQQGTEYSFKEGIISQKTQKQ